MFQRDRHRGAPGQSRSQSALARRSASPVLALQRAVGNRGTTRLIARERNKGTLPNGVKFGKFPVIEVKEGNLADWSSGKSAPDELTVATTKGKHSKELKRLSESKDRKDRIDSLELQTIIGENSWLKITIKNGHVRDYSDDGKTESWKLVDFDNVAREKTSIGKAR